MITPATPATRTPQVLRTPSWKLNHRQIPLRQRAWNSYERAKELTAAHKLTAYDIATCSQKFWDLHSDPLTAIDGATTTLTTIQYNLAAGTIAQYMKGRPELEALVDDLIHWRKGGQYMMTEVGHGLDIDSLETTATQLPSGEWIIDSNSPSGSKYMPPTVPTGLPTFAVLFAKMIVKGEDWGMRPFLVPLNDGKQMVSGVTAQLLPYRELSGPVNHSITTFKNVKIPAGALLGPLEKSPLESVRSKWRIAVGSLALGSVGLPAAKMHSYIGGKYSLRRHVGAGDRKVPLIYYRTQQIPVLGAIAASYVLEAYQVWSWQRFSDTSEDMRVRHGIASTFKAVAVQIAQDIALNISERCGAQGVQAYNMMTSMHAEVRGVAIAEGDILVLSLRLATELLLGRYALPAPANPDNVLAQHEAGLLAKYGNILKNAPHHRSSEVNKQVLPHGQRIVEAVGHRLAYDAAAAAGISPDILALYQSYIMKFDPAWYSENLGITIAKQEELEADALDALLPQIESLLKGLDVDKYVSAPIAAEESWEEFRAGLELFDGEGHIELGLPEGNQTSAHL